MCDKIIVKFMSMGDILYDTVAVKNLSSADMHFQEYLRHNFLPPTNKKQIGALQTFVLLCQLLSAETPPKSGQFF